jgi:carbon-monoxide dehydrogenase large subunit
MSLIPLLKSRVVYENGKFHEKGNKEKSITMAQVAMAAYGAGADEIPEGMEPGLEQTSFYDPENFVYPFGTHICVVDLDPETFQVKIRRYVAVDDCGTQINPMIVEGQIHGGVVQGLAQALYEESVYDSTGNLLTSTLSDYAVPTAVEIPRIESSFMYTPSPHNPIGVKGVGEAGSIAAPSAIVNAVVDALSGLGITHIDMPLKPENIWKVVKKAKV